jgi:hypothetical protein
MEITLHDVRELLLTAFDTGKPTRNECDLSSNGMKGVDHALVLDNRQPSVMY